MSSSAWVIFGHFICVTLIAMWFGRGSKTSAYWATLVPLLLVPIVSRLQVNQQHDGEDFYRQLALP